MPNENKRVFRPELPHRRRKAILSDEQIADEIDVSTEREYKVPGDFSVTTFDVYPLLQAQLDQDEKEYRVKFEELIDAYESMLENVGLRQGNFKASDWKYVKALKDKLEVSHE